MPICIYCRDETSGGEGDAHVLPESIIKNEVVLPAGTVCDTCNQYLGQLDSAIVNHRDISIAIQAFGIPGKGGRPRMRLGWLERIGSPDSLKTEIPGAAMQRVEIQGDRMSIDFFDPPGWDYRKFNRGLYHIAFNYLAHCSSPEALLEECFDPVRRYIRSPKRGDMWPFSAAIISDKPVRTISLCWLRDAPGASIGIQLFHYAYAVDLLRTAGLTEWLMDNGPESLLWSTTYGKTVYQGVPCGPVNPADQASS